MLPDPSRGQQDALGLLLGPGTFGSGLGDLVLPVALPGTEGISADVAVIGVGGVWARAGFTTTNLEEAQMMAQMIESAQRTIVVMHSSKFGRSAFVHIVRLDAIGLLITDQLPGT